MAVSGAIRPNRTWAWIASGRSRTRASRRETQPVVRSKRRPSSPIDSSNRSRNSRSSQACSNGLSFREVRIRRSIRRASASSKGQTIAWAVSRFNWRRARMRL